MKKTKLILLTLIIMLATILINTMEVQATLQANPNTHYKKADTPAKWMTNFRKMEETGGAMGLSETLNEDLTSSSGSNNIDVHMMRTTEYGAIAILSASGYGNSQTLQNSTIKTTTGNKTGVYAGEERWEYNAGGLKNSIFSGVNKKYYDEYTNSINSAKVGDALGEKSNNGCKGWHKGRSGNWVNVSCQYFKRYYNGFFSYCNDDSTSSTKAASCSRGVAVCGEGL